MWFLVSGFPPVSIYSIPVKSQNLMLRFRPKNVIFNKIWCHIQHELINSNPIKNIFMFEKFYHILQRYHRIKRNKQNGVESKMNGDKTNSSNSYIASAYDYHILFCPVI